MSTPLSSPPAAPQGRLRALLFSAEMARAFTLTTVGVVFSTPALARLLDEARAEAWDRRDEPHRHGDMRVSIVPAEDRDEDGRHERGCAGWNDCWCFGYLTPYRKDTP